jgi:ABC-type Fe3+-hydroxamate transport system substrate-binding protein
LGAKDRVVGIVEPITTYNRLLPELSKLPNVGIGWWEPDIEAILELNPDIVCTLGWPTPENLEESTR